MAELVADALHQLPAFSQASKPAHGSRASVHQLLGGGKSADVLLWKEKHISMALLVGSTVAWFLFEHSGYTLLSLSCNILLLLIVILFLWATIASLVNRPPPPIPEIMLTEETVHSLASTLRMEINKALVAAHDVAIGKDFRVFVKLAASLWIVSKLGAWFNFITLIYILLVGAHTVPLLYDRYQNEIESMLRNLFYQLKQQYQKVDANVLSRIPRSPRAKAH